MLFDLILGTGCLLIALNSLIATILLLLKDWKGFQESSQLVAGSLFVVLIMGFIGYNTIAEGVDFMPL